MTKPDKINGDIVISTIQKLFAVLTGQQMDDIDEDEEDDKSFIFDEKSESEVKLGDNLKLSPDYFQFIIIAVASMGIIVFAKRRIRA